MMQSAKTHSVQLNFTYATSVTIIYMGALQKPGARPLSKLQWQVNTPEGGNLEQDQAQNGVS